MSRDTRLDELDAYLAEHSAAAHNVGQVELELSRAVNDYDKRTLRSERDEHLSTMHYVEHRIVALFAASLSVSPVPSEPPDEDIAYVIQIFSQENEQDREFHCLRMLTVSPESINWSVPPKFIRGVRKLVAAADSPVPEPSEPQK